MHLVLLFPKIGKETPSLKINRIIDHVFEAHLFKCVYWFLSGIGFMTCISLDRYLAMVHPHRLQSLRSIKVVRRVCFLVWALVCLQIAPVLFRSSLYEHQRRRTCMEYFNFEESRFTPYLLLLACTISFCGPLVTILVCYTKINLKLHAAAKQNSIMGRLRRKHRANTIILLILLTFLVCFSPYHINMMQFMSRKIHHQPVCEELRAFKVSLQVRKLTFSWALITCTQLLCFQWSLFLQITVSLMNLNCCLDPLLYFFAIKTYKKRVLSLLKDLMCSPTVSSVMTAENSSSNTWLTPRLSQLGPFRL